MTTCFVITHVEPEGPHAIATGLVAAGVDVVLCSVHAGDRLPRRLDAVDGLVVMGGPMSAASDEGFATRQRELELLAGAVGAGIPTLGICLGAQLLAAAAGARVMAGSRGMEVGWGPVRLTPDAGHDALLAGLPSPLTVLHWHGDTFDLPPGAALLASNDRYRHQAFRVGEAAWGLQFHIEVDQGAVDGFLRAFGHDALTAGTTPEEIGAATPGALEALGPHRDTVVGRFADLVAQGRPSRTGELADRR